MGWNLFENHTVFCGGTFTAEKYREEIPHPYVKAISNEFIRMDNYTLRAMIIPHQTRITIPHRTRLVNCYLQVQGIE